MTEPNRPVSRVSFAGHCISQHFCNMIELECEIEAHLVAIPLSQPWWTRQEQAAGMHSPRNVHIG